MLSLTLHVKRPPRHRSLSRVLLLKWEHRSSIFLAKHQAHLDHLGRALLCRLFQG